MSENPNPTTCGTCGTENPPGQEFCRNCQAPLTISADADVIEPTPEGEDEPQRYAAGGDEDVPQGGLMGGPGGAAFQVPTERLDQDPTERPTERRRN